MNVLITGGAGFIGSHLAERLIADGHGVVVVDDLSTGSVDNIRGLLGEPRFQFVRDSVRNEVTMTPLVDRCDRIYHLAAAVGVKLIADRPVHTIETNIHGSEVTLGLANRFGRPILVASTSEVYGKNTKIPFQEEDDTLLGSTTVSRWCYACSKMVDEFLALAYHRQYGLPVVICRFFNTVGPRQTGQYGMVVPRFVQRALRNEPIEITGGGKQSRCFSHVADIVEAIIRLMDCPAAVGQVVNVGTEQSVTIDELADRVIAMTGSSSIKKYVSYEEIYGVPIDDMSVRRPDLTRVRGLIGYEPRYDLETILRQVIDYEKARI